MPSPTKSKKPSDRKPKTSNYGSSWKSPLHDLELPSGSICQVKRPGVQGLIKAGVLHSLDSLTAIVQQETIPKAEGKPTVDPKAIMDNPEKFSSMMDQVEKIVLHVVTQPKLYPITADHSDLERLGWEVSRLGDEMDMETERDPDRIYIDYVDEMDKMYIMNFAVGGSADLVEFRKKTSNALGGVSAGEADPAAPE